jgi:hypothetical protein
MRAYIAKAMVLFLSEPDGISHEQILTGFAHALNQFFQVGTGFVADGFRFVLFGFVAVGCGRQAGYFNSGMGSSI